MNTNAMPAGKPRIALLDDYYNRASQYADWSNAKFADFQFFPHHHASETELVADLQEFTAIGIMRERTRFPKHIIDQLPNLKLIVTSGMKNAAIDLKAATDQGIVVCGTESPGHATAELAFLMIMALSRQLLPLTNALQNSGNWQPCVERKLNTAAL